MNPFTSKTKPFTFGDVECLMNEGKVHEAEALVKANKSMLTVEMQQIINTELFKKDLLLSAVKKTGIDRVNQARQQWAKLFTKEVV